MYSVTVQRPAGRPLRLPVQGAPVVRSVSGVALAGGSGVEASGFWDDLGNWALKNAPSIISGLGGVLGF